MAMSSETTVTSVLSGVPIPKALAGIAGVSTGFQFKTASQSRLVITGLPGEGKSALMFSNPKAVVIDLDRGSGTVPDPKALRFVPPPGTGDKPHMQMVGFIGDFVDTLCKTQGLPYECLVLDSMDDAIDLWSRALKEEDNITDVGDYGGGHGKGYWEVRDRIYALMDKGVRAGLESHLVAHMAPKMIDVGNKKRRIFQLTASDSFKVAMCRRCEHMMVMERGTVTKYRPDKKIPGGKVIKGAPYEVAVRFLRTISGGLVRGGVAEDVKTRLPFPERIEIPEYGGWKELEAEFVKANEKRLACATSNEETQKES